MSLETSQGDNPGSRPHESAASPAATAKASASAALRKPALNRELFLANADHTLLSPEARWKEVSEFLSAAGQLGVARVCISSLWVAPAARFLAEIGSTIEICTVTGFPHGTVSGQVQAAEAAAAVQAGAREIDMVLQRGLVHAAAVNEISWDLVAAEIACVREACGGATLKVILETATLTRPEISGACAAALSAGADFVKTSTGFAPEGGASVDAVRLMRECVGERAGVKASGGIRSWDAAVAMWDAGATRFGVSATAQILAGAPALA